MCCCASKARARNLHLNTALVAEESKTQMGRKKGNKKNRSASSQPSELNPGPSSSPLCVGSTQPITPPLASNPSKSQSQSEHGIDSKKEKSPSKQDTKSSSGTKKSNKLKPLKVVMSTTSYYQSSAVGQEGSSGRSKFEGFGGGGQAANVPSLGGDRGNERVHPILSLFETLKVSFAPP